MESQNERMYILDLIDQGRISAAEGLGLLEALAVNPPDEAEGAGVEPVEQVETPRFEFAQPAPPQSCASQTSQTYPNAAEMQDWKRWWTIPFWIGVLIMVVGVIFMDQSLQAGGYGFGFFAAVSFFALGGLLAALAWLSRSAPWLHLRIQQAPGEKPERIAFSLPLPLHQAGWLLRLLGRRFPELQEGDWENLLHDLGTRITSENPVLVKVDEGEFGEKVEIYIG